MIATLRYIRLHVIPIIVWIIYLSQSNVFMIWYYDHEVTITRCRSLSFRPPWTHLLIVLCWLLYKWHNVLVYLVKFKCYVNRIGECGWAFVSINKRCTYLLNYKVQHLFGVFGAAFFDNFELALYAPSKPKSCIRPWMASMCFWNWRRTRSSICV